MALNRRQHEAYAILALTDLNKEPKPFHRVQSLDLSIDLSRENILEIANPGFVEQKADIPVVSLSLSGYQIAQKIDSTTSALHWLALLANGASSGDTSATGRTRVFIVGNPKQIKLTSERTINDAFNLYPVDSPKMDATCDILVPVRGASSNSLEATQYVANAYTTSLSLSFSVDGFAEWSADLEADNRRQFQGDSAAITAKSYTATGGETSVDLGENADEVFLVFKNGEELDSSEWSHSSGSSTVTLSSALSEGDIVRVVYKPSSAPNWTNYVLTTSPGDQGAIRRGELDIYLITDTTKARIVEGFVPSISGSNVEASAGTAWFIVNGEPVLVRSTSDLTTATSADDYVYLHFDPDTGTLDLVSQASPITDENEYILIGQVNSDASDIEDQRQFRRNRLSLIQSASFSIDLSREVINELGRNHAVSRSLNKPVTISVDVTAIDHSNEIVSLLSGQDTSATQVDFSSMSNKLGIQVNLYSSTDRTDANKMVVFEAIDMSVASESLSISTGGSGEISFTLNGDTFIALECASVE